MKTAGDKTGQRGIAIILVLLMLLVLSALGYMAMYTSSVEMRIDSAYRMEYLARGAGESGANYVIGRTLAKHGLELSEIPPASSSVNGANTGEVSTHDSIGTCMIVSPDGLNPGATQFTRTAMTCFRTGPVFDSNMMLLKTPQKVSSAKLVDIPGTSDYQHAIFGFYVSGGGPGRAVSEIEVMVKIGPVPKSGGGGTQY